MKAASRILKSFQILLAGLLTATLVSACVLIGMYLYFDAKIPTTVHAEQLDFNEPLRIYTADGRLIRKYGAKMRYPVTYEEIPHMLVAAFVAAEDDRFWEHPGVDYQGIIRAAINLVMTGTKSEGGSTITMQLARNLYLSPKRTFVRKIKEIILAMKLESKLTKKQILTLYLNKIYLGSGAYGVGAAARIYFDKKVGELTLAQAALIAGLPKAPTTYSPLNNPKLAKQRRSYVLRRMLETGKIDRAAYERAMAQPVETATHTTEAERFKAADYIAEMVRQKMIDRFGEERAYTEGFKVYTTITSERQKAALKALRRGLLAYDARHEWRGAQASVSDAVLTDHDRLMHALAQRPDIGWLVPAAVKHVSGDEMTLITQDYGTFTLPATDNPWLSVGGSAAALVSRGDLVWLIKDDGTDSPWELAQAPKVQGALVALDPDDGSVEALVGGFDFGQSQFNRAVDAYRQPGSAIKPFIYAAALANGFTTASLINDAPVVYGVGSDGGSGEKENNVWRPANYSHEVHGPTRLRIGLVHSRNLMTIRLLRAIGISTAVDYLARFGLPRDRMPRDLTLALGSATFTPLQMARGYAVFANGGYLIDPFLIKKIVGDNGRVIYRATPPRACPTLHGCVQLPSASAIKVSSSQQPKHDTQKVPQQSGQKWAPRVITAANAYLVGDMMRDVINRGTGSAAEVLGRSDLSGKTGTTDNTRDAWFGGFNGELVTVVWVGFDMPHTLGTGATGSQVALPIWIDFMREALEGVPKSIMPRPDNIVTVTIDPQTGQYALDGTGIKEIFTREEAPTPKEARRYQGFDPSEPARGRLF